MKDALLQPCAEWGVLLAANPEHLTPDERRALADHLVGCQGCQRAQADYALQDAFLLRQPAPLRGLPPKLLAAWAAEDGRALPGETPGVHTRPGGPAGARARGSSARRLAVQGVSAVAAVLVVALLVSALVASHLSTTNRPTGQVTQTPTPGTAMPTTEAATPTATPGSAGAWVIPPGLAKLSSKPVFAPSNPNVVYQLLAEGNAAQVMLRRSDNGGATWRALPLPPVTLDPNYVFTHAQFTPVVSPLDAQVVMLQLPVVPPQSDYAECPQVAAAGYQATVVGADLCVLHYLSRDGGLHWQRLALPVSQGESGSSSLEPMGNLGARSLVAGSAGPVLRAQGTRLYAVLVSPSGRHLIVSADGGQTWRLDDAGIGAANRYLCDAMPAPDGAVVFAFAYTSPCQSGGRPELWRSDDAGATWHRTGPLPMGDVYEQPFIVSSQGSRAMPLIYFYTPTGFGVPGDVKVSADGGATWQAAPENIGARLYTFDGPLGVLSDGSVLAGVELPMNAPFLQGATLYRWKPGEAAWQQMAPATPGTAEYVQVVGQPETVWLVTSDGKGSYTAQRLQPKA